MNLRNILHTIPKLRSNYNFSYKLRSESLKNTFSWLQFFQNKFAYVCPSLWNGSFTINLGAKQRNYVHFFIWPILDHYCSRQIFSFIFLEEWELRKIRFLDFLTFAWSEESTVANQLQYHQLCLFICSINELLCIQRTDWQTGATESELLALFNLLAPFPLMYLFV